MTDDATQAAETRSHPYAELPAVGPYGADGGHALITVFELNRTHIFAAFRDHAATVYRDGDRGPRDIHALDCPYAGLVVQVIDADPPAGAGNCSRGCAMTTFRNGWRARLRSW